MYNVYVYLHQTEDNFSEFSLSKLSKQIYEAFWLEYFKNEKSIFLVDLSINLIESKRIIIHYR